MARGMRACDECETAFPKELERCPRCGTAWAQSWNRKLLLLALSVVVVAIVLWLVVRYAMPVDAPRPG